MKKKRIDILLVETGLIESRNKAQRVIMAGEVFVNGQLAHKPSDQFPGDSQITIANKPKYVSRGGLKLEQAIKSFNLEDLNGSVCADVGASTGGFTDCLLQNGAQKVYAIDVGYGQLHQSLREDPRVIEMERHNVKEVLHLPEEIDVVTIDVSFISLKRVFPVISSWNQNKMLTVIALIKPQFEVGKKIAARGKGIIRNEQDRQNVITDIKKFVSHQGFQIHGVVESPIKGPKGNVEYLIHLTCNTKRIQER